MKKQLYDVEKITEAINVLKEDGQLFEIRILKDKTTISGYFKDVDTLAAELQKVDLRGANVFYTLNVVDDGCYSREQGDRFVQCKVTTSDADIVAYQWLLVDLDPRRKTGISSTRDELIAAWNKGQQIAKYMTELGFPDPVMACSGNGIHLLYGIYLKNNEENKQLVERCLKALAFMFNDDQVEVDTSVFNPARISKLYGTLAQKGRNTQERPHRMSRIISTPNTIDYAKPELLEQLAAELPETINKRPVHDERGFDVETWLEQNGIRIDSVKEWKDATKYVLAECPFDSNHKAPDSAVIKMQNGALAFKCLHNSCRGRDWHELRLKFEPDAYDDKRAEDDARYEAGWREWKAYLAYNRNRTDLTYTELEEVPENTAKMFETANDILSKPVEPRICIRTGLYEFDRQTGGFAKGEITLVSGLRGSAKSTWLSQVALNAVDQDFNVVMYSGELKDTRCMGWMFQQAAGPDWVANSSKFENYWYCRDEAKPKIADWLGERFHLYNNDYGNNFKALANNLNDIIKRLQSDLVIIDNMSILDLSDITDDRRADKWEQQKLFVETLKNLAMICRCHIVFVAHPRKAMGFLRLDDVGGSGSIGNLVDNAFIVHRVNKDFLRGYRRDILGIPDNSKKAQDNEDGYEYGGDNCIEIVKERETGIQDLFIPLWYDKRTKRMLNYENERKVYGWDNDGFPGGRDGELAPWEV